MSDESKKTVKEPDFEKLAKTGAPSAFNKIVTIILVAICVVLAAFIIYRVMTTESDAPLAAPAASAAETAAVNVSAEPAIIGDFSRVSRLNGEVRRSGDGISVYPDASSGTITEILVKRGDSVDVGDVVAYIDPSRPGASYKISPVVSKAAGIVSDIPVAVGQTVTSAQPIVTLAGKSDLVVEASVPEKFLGSLRTGMTASFETVAYPGRTYTARLAYISPSISTSSRTADIKLDIDGDTDGLKTGMYVKLYLETERIEDALMVPSAALGEYIGDDVVYAQIGELEPGELVITAGNITDGTAINPISSQG